MKNDKTTRDILISATARLVQLKGFDRTSVQDIMSEAGVGKGSFYHHFKSKYELGVSVLEHDRLLFMEMLGSCLGTDRGLKALERFFDKALEMHNARGFTGGCLWGNTAIEMSDCNHSYAELVDSVFREWVDKIRKVIEEGQEDGEIRKDATVSDLALLVVAALEGGIMLSRLRKDETPMRTSIDQLKLLLVDKENVKEEMDK